MFRKLFCKHNFEIIQDYERTSNDIDTGERRFYRIIIQRCPKCGSIRRARIRA